MTPEQEAEQIVKAVAAVQGNDPTDAEMVTILTTAITPIVRGLHALERIATVLEATCTITGHDKAQFWRHQK